MSIEIAFSQVPPQSLGLSRDDYIAFRVMNPLTADARRRVHELREGIVRQGLERTGDMITEELDELVMRMAMYFKCDCSPEAPVHYREVPLADWRKASQLLVDEIRERRR